MVQGSEGTRCHASNLIDFSYPDICSGQFFSLRNPRPVGCHVSIIYLSKVISVILRRWVRSIFEGSWAYACVVDLLLRLPPILPHSLVKGKYVPTKRSPFFDPFYNMISSKMRCHVFDSDGLMNASNAFESQTRSIESFLLCSISFSFCHSSFLLWCAHCFSFFAKFMCSLLVCRIL